jgi:hypothetical protein
LIAALLVLLVLAIPILLALSALLSALVIILICHLFFLPRTIPHGCKIAFALLSSALVKIIHSNSGTVASYGELKGVKGVFSFKGVVDVE